MALGRKPYHLTKLCPNEYISYPVLLPNISIYYFSILKLSTLPLLTSLCPTSIVGAYTLQPAARPAGVSRFY